MSAWDEENKSGSGNKSFGSGGSRYNKNYSYEDAIGDDNRRGEQSVRGRGRGRGGGRGSFGGGDRCDDNRGDSYGNRIRGEDDSNINRRGFAFEGGRGRGRGGGNNISNSDRSGLSGSSGRGGGNNIGSSDRSGFSGSSGRGGGNNIGNSDRSGLNGSSGQRGSGGSGARGRDGDFANSRGAQFNNNKGEGSHGAEENDEKPREFYIPPTPSNDEAEIFSSGIMSGINFSKYDNIPLKITGEDVPTLIDSFDDVGFRKFVMDNINKSGYKTPTPIQKAAIPAIQERRDVMACAQTGSGKTAAYLLPIINRLVDEPNSLSIGKPQALIISPTRELSIQIFNEARKFAHGSILKISIVYGGTSTKYQSENIGKGCHILICTPGRLHDFVSKSFITFEDTRFVVLDEADRMLDMGFKESVNQIMTHDTLSPPRTRQVLMFSATFPEAIQRLAADYLRNYIFVAVGVVGGACSDVTQTIYEVKKFQKRTKLMEILNEDAEGTIVFVETKRGADFLASFLSETDFPTTSIHGDRLQRQREMALTDFKSGKMKVLIATSVAARGLDIKNVSHVINYDLPTDIDEYVHRIGRTGRVGNNGRATSFFDPEHDAAMAGPLVEILKGADQKLPAFLEKYEFCGDGNSQNPFGGRDVRRKSNLENKKFNMSTGPSPLEETEIWE